MRTPSALSCFSEVFPGVQAQHHLVNIIVGIQGIVCAEATAHVPELPSLGILPPQDFPFVLAFLKLLVPLSFFLEDRAVGRPCHEESPQLGQQTGAIVVEISLIYLAAQCTALHLFLIFSFCLFGFFL